MGCEIPDYAPNLRALEDAKRGEKWARAALEGEAALVAGAVNGTRNATLNNAAIKLGHKVGGGYLNEAEVESALFGAAQLSGLLQEDGPEAVRATIRSGLTAGIAEPEHPQDRPDYRPTALPHASAEPERSSRFYSAASLKGKAVPPRQWIVPDMVPRKTVTLFSGHGGVGKSLLALQLAVAAAAQASWLGKPVKAGRVLVISAEDDDDELHRRLEDILTAECLGYDDIAGLTLRSLAGEDALLAVESQLALIQTELFRELEARAVEEGPVLIVIDTLADVYPSNENDRGKARQFVGILRGLAIRRNCAVLLLGHPSLTGLANGTGTSGSTGWHNSVRSRLYMSRITDNGFEPDPDARVLSTQKANYGPTKGEISLKWEDGRFVAEAQPTGLDALAAGVKGERVFLKLLDTLTAQGRYVSANPGPTYAPTQFASHPEAEGCTKRVLKAAMDKLFGRGEIVVTEHGSGAKARSHIARKGAGHAQE